MPLPAYDDVIQAVCGLAALTSMQTSCPPAYVPMVIADRIAGLNAVHAVLAVLVMREKIKRGQRIEIPMFETLAALVLADQKGAQFLAGNRYDCLGLKQEWGYFRSRYRSP